MVEIVAEVAQGYEGDPTLARLLARGAVEAGADAVKFQLVYADELATPNYKHYELFKSLEMEEATWAGIAALVRDAGKKLYFDVYGDIGLEIAQRVGADGLKLSTTEFFNHALVAKVFAATPRVFVAIAGMSLAEIEAFLARHRSSLGSALCFLYGVQNSPTNIEDSHLRRIGSLKQHLKGFQLGLMDHADGASDDALILPLLALPFGVEVIEKHITLDRLLRIEDFTSALPPERFGRFVQMVRRFEPALGMASLEPTAMELDYRRRTVKVVVARVELRPGTLLEMHHLTLKRTGVRPGGDLFSHDLDELVGKTLRFPINANEPIPLANID